MNEIVIRLQSWGYRKLLGSVLPVRWFSPAVPDITTAVDGRLNLEIVSHCWGYSHLLAYQIGALINHPPVNVDITYTLCYCPEDTDTDALVKHCAQLTVPSVSWNFKPLEKGQLFRRAIGRNQAALATSADWVWFTDCDTIFHAGCLDSLAAAVQDNRQRMLFPASERITPLLGQSHELLAALDLDRGLPDIDQALFTHNDISKAKGAFQIVNGTVCRAVGYCRDIGLFQAPTDKWRKTYEDTVFRKLIGTEGSAIDLVNLYRIRHIEKGRYTQNSAISDVRKTLRKNTDRP